MDDLVNPSGLVNSPQAPPLVVIIAHHVLARTSILSILKRELTSFEIVEMAAPDTLNWFSGRDVRLIALNIGDKEISDPSIEESLALFAESFPKAYVALLSNRDDEATASAAMRRGVRGLFPTSIPVEIAIAGLRLVLAGGVYRPLPVLKQEQSSSVEPTREYAGAIQSPAADRFNGGTNHATEKPTAGLTPREKSVLAELALGLPNKLIAAKLCLSENTVKMHVQHIMRKCSAHNRTEAVLRWSGRLSDRNRGVNSRLS